MKKIFLLLLIFNQLCLIAQYNQLSSARSKDIANEKRMGASIAVSEKLNILAIGAPGDMKGKVRSGAVYLFNGENYDKQYLKIKSPEIMLNQYFGIDIEFNNQNLIIGAPGKGRYFGGPGKAYIFSSKSNFSLETAQTLSPEDSQNKNYFGSSVCIKGKYAFVGAPGCNRENGKLYIFKKINNDWKQVKVLSPECRSRFYGASADVSGKTLIVGAPYENDYNGAIYIYKLEGDNWQFSHKIEGNNRSCLGDNIAIDKNIIVSGNSNEQVGGRVHIFHKQGDKWIEKSVLAPTYGDNIYSYGTSLDLKDGKLVVGASGYNDYRGCIYAYKMENNDPAKWKNTYKSELGIHMRTKSYLGSAVKFFKNNMIIVGASGDNYKNGEYLVFKSNKKTKKVYNKNNKSSNNKKTYQSANKLSADNHKTSTLKTNNTRNKVSLYSKLNATKEIKFANITEGERKSKIITITNTGNRHLDINNIKCSENLNVSHKSFSVKPNGRFDFSVSFNATKAGNYNGFIVINSNSRDKKHIIEVKCLISPKQTSPLLSFNNNIDLGNITLGDKKDFEIRLANTGDSDLKIRNIISPEYVKIKNSNSFIIKPGSEKTINLTFYPTETNIDESKIIIKSNSVSGNNRILIKSRVKVGGNSMMIKNAGLIISPTPFDKRLLINTAEAKGDFSIEIKTFMNESVFTKEFKKGDNRYIIIPTGKLKKGAYIVVVKDDNSFPKQGSFNIM